MIADEERRKVAQKLREYASWDEDGELVGCTEFGESVLNLLSCGDTERECFNALADLIEPEPERTARMEYDAVHCDYVCTHCGELYYTMLYYAVVGDDHRVDFKSMRFCPNCGVKFREDDDDNE